MQQSMLQVMYKYIFYAAPVQYWIYSIPVWTFWQIMQIAKFHQCGIEPRHTWDGGCTVVLSCPWVGDGHSMLFYIFCTLVWQYIEWTCNLLISHTHRRSGVSLYLYYPCNVLQHIAHKSVIHCFGHLSSRLLLKYPVISVRGVLLPHWIVLVLFQGQIRNWNHVSCLNVLVWYNLR